MSFVPGRADGCPGAPAGNSNRGVEWMLAMEKGPVWSWLLFLPVVALAVALLWSVIVRL